ncbi:MAG: metallophosphoesterase family protein [Chthoniobacter sp.]|nr:metallophosphoesterase family protein [Chthoniobacter sp.]
MRIAVISDTHDRLPGHITAAIAEADEIWHLGDVCQPTIVETLKVLGPKIRIVRGNCDEYAAWPLTLDFQLAGHRFHLEHIPSRVAPAGSDFFLHGHTHVPRDETIGGVRFLNPGCITRPNRGAPASYAWLRLGAKSVVEWELVRV